MISEGPEVRRRLMIALALILLLGAFLRLPPALFAGPDATLRALRLLHPQPGYSVEGFDEHLYRQYVYTVSKHGLSSYPQIVEAYIKQQADIGKALLPPLRFLYIFAATLWRNAFGTDELIALRNVASIFSILTLLSGTAFAWRARGLPFAVGLAALMSFGPMLLHMSQHALADGFFTFWTVLCLWSLWETLRAPRNWYWLGGYTISLCCLVLTKENAFFAFVGILAIVALSRWLAIGVVSPELLAATFVGPVLGAVVLVCLAGGLTNAITTYRDLVYHAERLDYAILTGDGPWYRYLVDLMLVSPVVLLLATAAVFQLNRAKKLDLFCAIFIAASYLVMCNVRNGMNIRYGNMWEMPLRMLALSQLGTLTSRLAKYRTLVLIGAVGLLCAVELRNYVALASEYPLYELVTEQLMRALHILKTR